MIHVEPNANFHSLGGVSVHDNPSVEYQEYRRCWMEYPQHFILREFPMHLDLEASSRCNLRCTFCDKNPLLTRDQQGDMDFELYKKIIDEGAANRLWGVKLNHRGEPLLNKNIIQMVDYAKTRGVLDIFFNTNGMLLTRSMSERLIDAGLSRISISVEGTDPQAYESKRLGARFETILKNLEALLDLRQKRGTDHPKVRIQTVLLPGLDINEYKNFWSAYGDEVAGIDFNDTSVRESELHYDWGCPQLWQRMTIEWDGTVFPCNNDYLRLLPAGQARDRTIYKCWHDPRVEEVRNLHRLGQSQKIAACDGCPWRTAQIKKLKVRDN